MEHQHLWCQILDPQMAKLNSHGNLITSRDALKNLYLQTYANRLKHREMDAKLMDVFFLKMKLWESRLHSLRHKKTANWTPKSLDKVLSQLKNNISRDPHGMVNELFKKGVAGKDLNNALLMISVIPSKVNKFCQNVCLFRISQQFTKRKAQGWKWIMRRESLYSQLQ